MKSQRTLGALACLCATAAFLWLFVSHGRDYDDALVQERVASALRALMVTHNATVALATREREARMLCERRRRTGEELQQQPPSPPLPPPLPSAATSHMQGPTLRTALEEECYNRYSYGLLEQWVAKRELWCSGGDSSLECYPHRHAHKSAGSPPELFCEARNFTIDFSKISGEPFGGTGSRGMTQYLKFAPSSTLASCRKTKSFKEKLFMAHSRLQMATFKDGVTAGVVPTQTVKETTYLLARDEDSENAFHSTSDFLNMFMVTKMLNVDVKDIQVVLFDRQPNNPFYDMIQQAFSPNHPLKRASDYNGKKVRFERLVFHLESPAGLIFPGIMDPMRCRNSELWNDYRKHILRAFNLWDVAPPPIPKVVFVVRRRTAAKNVGRVLQNEDELVAVLKKADMIDLEVVDLAQMTYVEQLKTLRSANVLIGVHGAGLMNVMFTAEEAVLVELHPPYRLDRHFRVASRLTGKIYMPYRGGEVACSGSSDAIRVPPAEFASVVDAALRIARSFDDGHTECGMQCPSSYLALDKGNDAHYKRLGRSKGSPLKTNFPCKLRKLR